MIHNYRWRLSVAEGDPQYDDLEKRLAEGPAIAVPTITLDGDSDGVAPASDGTSSAKKFSGKRTHRIIKSIGHNLPQVARRVFAEAVVEVDSCGQLLIGVAARRGLLTHSEKVRARPDE
jgi:pimeloyl-ACP methyl ester carboxylesterase